MRLTTALAVTFALALTGVAPTSLAGIEQAAAADAVYDPEGPQGTVYRLYRAYFEREPDAGGYDYWVTQYNQGYPLPAISNDFARSAEFQATYGSLDDRGFLDTVYKNVLDRAPDQGGYDYWLGQMNQGMKRGFVMIYFSDSAEFRSKTATGVPPGYRMITQYESDVAKIKSMYRAVSDGFGASTTEGFRRTAAYNYPGMGNSYEACRTWGWGGAGEWAPEGYSVEYIVDEPTVERDDGWTMPDGPIAGQRIEGRIYIQRVEIYQWDPWYGSNSGAAEVHATVLADGSVKFFLACYPR